MTERLRKMTSVIGNAVGNGTHVRHFIMSIPFLGRWHCLICSRMNGQRMMQMIIVGTLMMQVMMMRSRSSGRRMIVISVVMMMRWMSKAGMMMSRWWHCRLTTVWIIAMRTEFTWPLIRWRCGRNRWWNCLKRLLIMDRTPTPPVRWLMTVVNRSQVTVSLVSA